MNLLAIKTGRYACFIIVILKITFFILLILFPPVKFVSAKDYMLNFNIKTLLPVIPALVLVFANVPLFISLFYIADNGNKIFALTGIIYGGGYVLCSGINYFIQLSVVPEAILNENQGLLSMFAMINPGSFGYSLDNFGYFFLALAFIFFSPDFKDNTWIKTFFLIFSITAILGTLGYLLKFKVLENLILISALPYLAGVVLLYFELGKLKRQ